MPRPLKASIHLSAIRHNLALARRYAPASRVLAVIKANGYGHGMLRAALALRDADALAVLSLDEAATLRAAGVSKSIVLLEGLFNAADIPAVVENRVACVVHRPDQVEWLCHAVVDQPVAVWLKINSGMNRLGFPPAVVAAIVARLRQSAAVGHLLLMTHLATADESRGVAWQLDVFRQATAAFVAPTSLANSAALLRYPQTHADWVRPGIMLYGVSPFAEESAVQIGLRPAMTLHSEVIAVQRVSTGESVGYGEGCRVTRPTRVGIVACGYADGYPRHAPSGTPILVNGARTGLLGRVSMDMLAVDLTDLPAAAVGSPVVLWGEGLPVEDVARAAGTIGYELLCALAPRVPIADVE